MIIYKNTAKEV